MTCAARFWRPHAKPGSPESAKASEYRLCHKNGSRRILESTASTIRNDKQEVEKLVIVNRGITDRKHAEEQLAHNALHDAMTGLPNRRLFLDRLQRCFAEAQHDFTFHYAVVLLDLDRFKIFNDTMGTVGEQWPAIR